MVWQHKIDQGMIHPGLVSRINLVHAKMAEWGVPVKAYSGSRTFAEQNELFAKGRDSKGKVVEKNAIVTNARGGESPHNYCLAVDQAFLLDPDNPKGRVRWSHKIKKFHFWEKLEKALFETDQELDAGAEWDGVDYEWGGRWRFRDCPHIQVRTTLTELKSGHYPYCRDVEWLVKAHTTFLFPLPWMRRRVQYLLNMQSYNAGHVDGVLGNRTFKAMNSFQEDHDLAVGNIPTMPFVGKLVRVHQGAVSSRPADNGLVE